MPSVRLQTLAPKRPRPVLSQGQLSNKLAPETTLAGLTPVLGLADDGNASITSSLEIATTARLARVVAALEHLGDNVGQLGLRDVRASEEVGVLEAELEVAVGNGATLRRAEAEAVLFQRRVECAVVDAAEQTLQVRSLPGVAADAEDAVESGAGALDLGGQGAGEEEGSDEKETREHLEIGKRRKWKSKRGLVRNERMDYEEGN
jgi:hypothetical protein